VASGPCSAKEFWLERNSFGKFLARADQAMMIGAAMELVLAPTRPRSNSDSRIGKRGPLWDLAARGHIAVYPTYGWWNKRPNLMGYEKSTHYALVATITTPTTDIYTPVANAINIPILVET
jgi:hypothetical protein